LTNPKNITFAILVKSFARSETEKIIITNVKANEKIFK
jgi:hypothetical protein